MSEPSADDILREVLRLQDQVTESRGEAMHPANVREAVADGIKLAVSDPALWRAALAAMQQHAQAEAGGWLLGWIRALMSKALLFVLVGLAVYAMGGWGALLAFFKSAPTQN